MDIHSSKKELLEALINGTAKLRQEINEFLTNTEQPQDADEQFNKILNDVSIIDITNESFKLPRINPVNSNSSNLTIHIEVPYWQHQYVYSYSEINSASQDQRRFYFYLKNKFFNQEFVELEGNSNYAFILLFDLLQEYDRHQKIVLLESQFDLLGEFYPKTKPYIGSFLAKKFEEKGDFDAAYQVRIEYNDYWSFGSKYKKTLSLNKDEVKLLNHIYSPRNNFIDIEFCCLEVIKLYLSVVKQLNINLIEDGTNIDEQIKVIADLVARKQFRYRLNSQNYNYCLQTFPNEFYTNIFKQSENAVREHYGHKRKLNADANFTNTEVKNEFEMRIGTKLKEVISELVSNVDLPDEKTEIELNAKTSNRWKLKFKQLTENYDNDAKQFVENIVQLGNLNKKNPSIENIFFEASKFVAKSDKHASLTLYVYYLYHDLKSANFDNKQLPKTIQKQLFKNEVQRTEFENLINDLVSNCDLQKALKEISEIYAVKRKRIQLDSDSIIEVQQQHSGTVKLLNSVLNDEYDALNEFLLPELELMVSFLQEKIDDEHDISPTTEIIETEEITSVSSSIFRNSLQFSTLQVATLELFQKHNLSVSQNDFENFANTNGALKNQLIDGINDVCYEFLDDVLIEEEEDFYTIYENYYNKLLN